MDAVQGADAGELDAGVVGAEADVVVGVDEAGQDELAAGVDAAGAGSGPGLGPGVGSDPDDQSVVDGEGLGLGQVRVDGVDAGSGEQQVGGEGVAGHAGGLPRGRWGASGGRDVGGELRRARAQ